MVVLLAMPGPSRGATEPTLRATPQTYIPGQLITYRGDAGAAGVKVLLQGSQREGAPWSTHARTRSDAAGRYRFSVPAPSMMGIRRRVVVGGVASNVLEMYGKSQDLVVAPAGTPPYRIVAQGLLAGFPHPGGHRVDRLRAAPLGHRRHPVHT